MKPRIFHVGDQVIECTRCTMDGIAMPESKPLIVIAETTIPPEVSSVPHHRIKARAENGNTIEACESSFRFAHGNELTLKEQT